MDILNIHERELPASADAVGALIDSLGSRESSLWPSASWPSIRLDRPLGVGAAGGHGPIGYIVEEYRPGEMVRCRFTRPRGFDGHHWFEVVPQDQHRTVLRHTIQMRIQGMAMLSWPLVVRPLHDALLEDALALAQASLGIDPVVRRWSWWVRFLRWSMSGGHSSSQKMLLATRPDTLISLKNIK